MRTPLLPRGAPPSSLPPRAGGGAPAPPLPVPHRVLVTPRWLALKYRSMRGHESRDPELRDWQRNYRLNPVNTFSLFDEFMEMSAWAGAGGLGLWGQREHVRWAGPGRRGGPSGCRPPQ